MKKAFVTLKFAQSIDGRIATSSFDSKWISSDASLKFAHELRAEHDAILVGINTIKKDNPSLNVRHVKGENPIRIILDKNLDIPTTANVVTDNSRRATIIITTKQGLLKTRKIKKLEQLGIKILDMPVNKKGHFNLKSLCELLYKQRIKKILVEGGSKIITSFLAQQCVDELVIIIAPKIIGLGISSINDLKIRKIKDALNLKIKTVLQKGDDYIFRLKIK